MRPDFDQHFTTYFAGCQRIAEAYRAKHYALASPEPWRTDRLAKRIRVVSGTSAHSFVDLKTGDVLKAASWAAPAKHARGNIFDADNGLGTMGPYGPAYLR